MDRETDVPSPLSECFLRCETEGVRECCGIDEISTDPELIAARARSTGPETVVQARQQPAELIAVSQIGRVESRRRSSITSLTTTTLGRSCWTFSKHSTNSRGLTLIRNRRSGLSIRRGHIVNDLAAA